MYCVDSYVLVQLGQSKFPAVVSISSDNSGSKELSCQLLLLYTVYYHKLNNKGDI